MIPRAPGSTREESRRSRYPGTRPFTDSPDDQTRFFGRTGESEQVYLRVLSVPLLVQFGKSGLGKTSLLQAGLFPRLRQKPFLPVMVRLNVETESLTAAAARSIKQSCETEGLDYSPGATRGLWELLTTTTVWRGDLLLTPVLVFDQFEEVFTLRDARFRAEIAAELGALASGVAPARLLASQSDVRPQVKIVISLREDYLGSLEEFSAAIPGLFHERLRLEPLSEKAARDAVTCPAQLTAEAGEEPYWAPRFEFDAPALDSMIEYLKGSSGVIEPFQLQLLCRHAETTAHDKAGGKDDPITLTRSDFSGSRDFATVLGTFYRSVLQKISPRSQRKRAEALCEEGLLGSAGHRLMLEEEQTLSEFRLTRRTLDTLAQERVVRRERRLESVFYEISHDRLAESIFASRRTRLPRNLKRALWAAAVVAVVIVGFVVWKYKAVREERDKARNARNSAVKARDSAEAMLSFLLGEQFLGEVRDIGRSSLLEQVQENVKGVGERTPLNRALALRNRGDILRMRGHLPQSVVTFREAVHTVESSVENGAPRETARTRGRLAEALDEEGHVQESYSEYERAVADWRGVVGGAGVATLTADCVSLADALASAANANTEKGQAVIALRHLNEALEITSNILFGRRSPQTRCGPPPDGVDPYPDADALQAFANAVGYRTYIYYSEDDDAAAAALALQAKWLKPLSIRAKTNALGALTNRGLSSTPEAAIADYRKVLSEFDEMRRWDPQNRLWQGYEAEVRLLVSNAILDCHAKKGAPCRLDDAEALALEGLATLRELHERDPGNTSLRRQIAYALQIYAKVLSAQARHPAALASLEEASRLYDRSDREPVDAQIDDALRNLRMQQSEALAALHRLPEALATLEKAAGGVARLVAAHPDQPLYVAFLYQLREREATLRSMAGDERGAAAARTDRDGLRQTYQDLIKREDDEIQRLDSLQTKHSAAAKKLAGGGDNAAALREYALAESALRDSILLRPGGEKTYRELDALYDNIDSVQQALGLTRERLAVRRASMHAAQIAAWLAPKESQKKMDMIALHARYNFSGYLYAVAGKPDDALSLLQEVVAVAESSTQSDRDATALALLGRYQCRLGQVRRELKKAGWEEALRSGLIHFAQAAAGDKTSLEPVKGLGFWHAYLAKELYGVDRPQDAAKELQFAREAYRRARRLAPADDDVKAALRDVTERLAASQPPS